MIIKYARNHVWFWVVIAYTVALITVACIAKPTVDSTSYNTIGHGFAVTQIVVDDHNYIVACVQGKGISIIHSESCPCHIGQERENDR